MASAGKAGHRSAGAGKGGAQVLFADARPKRLDPDLTLPAKFGRMLDGLDLKSGFGGKRTAVKMHLGNNVGYTTIHPLFVSILVEKLKAAGARPFVTDMGWNARAARSRGYIEEVIGCPVRPACGESEQYLVTKSTGSRLLPTVDIAGEVAHAEAMVDFSHAKGHGNTAYGGACKNLAMGAVSNRTRRDIHRLEGGIEWIKAKCAGCGRCVEACERDAIKMDKPRNVSIFVHSCGYCGHCVLACPKKAIRITNRNVGRFQKGMALATREVLRRFDPKRVLYVNVILNVTIFCDCWGMSTPALIPDVGIMASRDIVAIETATLEAIKVENLIPGSLAPGYELRDGRHLFERIHGKDPFVQVQELERLGLGKSGYKLVEVR